MYIHICVYRIFSDPVIHVHCTLLHGHQFKHEIDYNRMIALDVHMHEDVIEMRLAYRRVRVYIHVYMICACVYACA